jgi:plastocyanin
VRALVLVLAAIGVTAPAAHAADSAQITAGLGNRYLTPTVEVDQGGRVTFANRDAVSHDVTARDEAGGKPLFASPLVAPGASAGVDGVQYLRTGSYAFFCSVHPQMTGTLRVTAAGTPAPRPGSGGGPAARDTSAPRLGVARPRRLRVVVTSDEAARIRVTARRGGRTIARGSARLPGAGRATVRLRPTAAGKRALRRGRRARAVLTVGARDAAGNRATVRRRAVLRR